MEESAEAAADEEIEINPPVFRLRQVNKLSHSILSNVNVCINNQQINISDGLCAHKSSSSKYLEGTISD